MRRRRGMFRLPVWAQYWMLGCGLAFVAAGWIWGGTFWFVAAVVALGWGVLMDRMYANVTLERSKERGIVIWAYRKKHAPTDTPQLIWADEQPTPLAAPEATPPAPDDVKERPRLEDWPLGPMPAADSTETAEPAAVAEREPAPVPRDTGRKICPDCAETVLSEARVCRFCGYRFAPAAVSVPPESD